MASDSTMLKPSCVEQALDSCIQCDMLASKHQGNIENDMLLYEMPFSECSCKQWLSQFQGLIFDCDGTLIDTMPSHFESYQVVCRKYDLKFGRKEFYSLGGMPAEKIFDLIATRRYGENHGIDLMECVKLKQQAFEEVGMKNIQIIKRVALLITLAKSMNIPIAVSSGGERDDVLRSLTLAGLDKYFPVVVTRDDVEHGKPAPDCYLLAAKLLGVDPKKCAGFEDAEKGMEAILAANMTAVDVRNLRAYPRPDLSNAD